MEKKEVKKPNILLLIFLTALTVFNLYRCYSRMNKAKEPQQYDVFGENNSFEYFKESMKNNEAREEQKKRNGYTAQTLY